MRLISDKQRGYDTRLIWAREDPLAYNKKNEDIITARELIKKLRSGMHGGKLLTSFQGPMGCHAKLALIDDARVLVTSDNFLAYGDASLKSDSRELGVLIDSPRISNLVRGELELMHKELRAKTNWYKEKHLRWAVALAVAVKETSIKGKVKAGIAIQSMLNRCFDDEVPNELWRDLEYVRGNMENDRFVCELIRTARKMKLFCVPSKDFFKLYSKGNPIKTKKLNNLLLSLPSPNHIWENVSS
jgi:hypothetical protein